MKLTKFKSVSISLVVMMSISSVSFAQNSKKISTKEMAEKKTEMMKQSLDLTKNQAKKVYEINLNYIEARKACMAKRPALPKDGKHFKGAVCPPAPEAPHAFECERPKPEFRNIAPDGKPMMKPDCNKPCPQMKPGCDKPKCDSSFMHGKPNCSKGVKPNFKHDSITCKYHNDLKQVLRASQYDKWMKIQCERMKNHNNGHKPMPCPR
ncbi:MAG: hypothetical protein IKU59_00785 [Bacteroidales bacterium]|nr:hypothetical protein [Bacteroidales bacterium]